MTQTFYYDDGVVDSGGGGSGGATFPAGTTANLIGATGTTDVGRLVTVGTGLSLSAGGVLTATGTSTPTPGILLPVTNTYTASGTIAVTDNLAVINSASATAMTLASGAVDGHVVNVKNYGAGTVTLTADIDGTAANTVLLHKAPPVQDCVTLAWWDAQAMWLVI